MRDGSDEGCRLGRLSCTYVAGLNNVTGIQTPTRPNINIAAGKLEGVDGA